MHEVVDETIRDTLEQARNAAGGAAALSAALRDAGVSPDAGGYSASAISNWVRGRVRPPADVVLAAAALYNLPLDGRLGLSATQPESDPLADAVRQLRSQVDALVRPNSEAPAQTQDVVAVYATRSEAAAAHPLLRMVAGAVEADLMGLSLNALCQGISDVTLAELIEGGLTLRCLFLDPDGEAIRQRETDEAHEPDVLVNVTRSNIAALTRIAGRLSEDAAPRLQVRTYDQNPRFNLTITDHRLAVVQLYLHSARGLDSPSLVIESDPLKPHGLFPTFHAMFEEAWTGATA